MTTCALVVCGASEQHIKNFFVALGRKYPHEVTEAEWGDDQFKGKVSFKDQVSSEDIQNFARYHPSVSVGVCTCSSEEEFV